MRRNARSVGAVSCLVLALVLEAPAAAEEASTKPRIAVIEFKSQPGQSAPAPLQILGFAWSDTAPAGGGFNEIAMDDTAGKDKKPASTGVQHDLHTNVVARTATGGDPDRPVIAGSVPNPPASPGANETITIGGGRTEAASGQATGKRQHMPIRVRSYYEQPRGEGSVWIRVGTPWAACRVGARYPSLSLSGGAQPYVLEDVRVASCGGAGGEEVALNYKKVKVRAWNPEKKED